MQNENRLILKICNCIWELRNVPDIDVFDADQDYQMDSV